MPFLFLSLESFWSHIDEKKIFFKFKQTTVLLKDTYFLKDTEAILIY